MQPIVTDRVVVRGHYQTVPLVLSGVDIQSVARGGVESSGDSGSNSNSTATGPHALSVAEALARLPGRVCPPTAADPLDTLWKERSAPMLQQLLAYWRAVGTSERAMLKQPLPMELFKHAAAVADAVCDAVASPSALTTVGTTPLGDPEEGDKEGGEHLPPPSPLDWLDEAVDMAMGWCSLLAAGAAGRTAAAVHCSTAGLACILAISTHRPAGLRLLARHGPVLLANVLTMPRAPPALTRMAIATSLTLILTCGPLACEAVLAWWKPPTVVWKVKVRGCD
jgi:hypothetical protein